MIADNRLAEQATWDPKLLAEQLRELCDVELDFDLEATGFEVGEIDVLIEGASPEVKGNSDPADELPENRSIGVTRAGDLGCWVPTGSTVQTLSIPTATPP